MSKLTNVKVRTITLNFSNVRKWLKVTKKLPFAETLIFMVSLAERTVKVK